MYQKVFVPLHPKMITRKMTEQNEIVLYRPDETLSLDVRVAEESVWLSQQQMADLFGVNRQAITKHLKNIYETAELNQGATCSILELVQKEGNRMVKREVAFYNLDAIISVGFRVNTQRGIQFRQWANNVLKQYLLTGAAVHRQIVALQERIDDRMSAIESRQDEQQQQLDFFIRTSTPPAEMVFMHGEFFTARVALEKLIRTAQKRAVIIDSYVDAATFEMLDVRAEGVEATIYTEGVGKGLTKVRDLHNEQSGREPIEIYKWRVESHDRWLVIDDILYHLGPSAKDAGRKIGAIIRMGTSPELILNEMR